MLDFLDHVAAIATAAVAVYAYATYRWGRRAKRLALERYLALERPGRRYGADKGQRTILHLVAELRMSEADIVEAAFDSQKVLILRTQHPQTGLTNGLLFQHIDMPKAP